MSLFRAEEERVVRDLLGGLERDVELELVTGPAEATVFSGARELDATAEARRLVHGLAELGPRLRVVERDETGPGRYPALTIGGRLRFYGLPWGYELSSVVGAIVDAGRAELPLLPASRVALAGLERPVELEVYVTPT